MLKYERNKLISIARKDQDTLGIHGILDDDIYSLEMNVSISISDLQIVAIDGKWNRWTTPECPRSTGFLEEAVGFRIEDEGFSQKVRKVIGRKSCRHYANLLLECCHSAREALVLVRWENERALNKELTFQEFLAGKTKTGSTSRPLAHAPRKHDSSNNKTFGPEPAKHKLQGGMIIDLHVHTHPASPCSSARVDQVIEEAKNIGLDGICLTDHNHAWDPVLVEGLRQGHGFLVIRGNEITTDQGDTVVFGLERDIQGIIRLEDLSQEVQEAGGFIIAVHPFRGFLTFNVEDLGLTPEKAMERPLFRHVGAMEVLNGKVTEKENRFAKDVAEGLGMPITGGSDAHEVSEVGVYATRFATRIKDEKDLIEALKSGKYTPVAFKKEIQEAEKGK